MSWRGVLAVVAGVAIACVISGLIGGVVSGHVGHSTYSVSYADFISILLTGISLLLAMLALMVGIFAIIGWTTLSTKVKRDTHQYLRAGFRPGKDLHKLLVAELNKVPFEGASPFDDEFTGDAKAQDKEDSDAE